MQISCALPKEGEVREPELLDSLWLNNEREVVYEKDGRYMPVRSKKELPANFLGGNSPYHWQKDISLMLKKLFKQRSDSFYIDTRRGESSITRAWVLREFLFAKESKKRDTKKQRLVDEMNQHIITKYPFTGDDLDEIKSFCRNYVDMIFCMEVTPLWLSVQANPKTLDGRVPVFITVLGHIPIPSQKGIQIFCLYEKERNQTSRFLRLKLTITDIWFNYTALETVQQIQNRA